MSDDLERFVAAQGPVIDGVLEELRRGRKTGHWMWFVFPQLRGLGRSEYATFYGIDGLGEARRYLAHLVLGDRLRRCVQAVLAVEGRTAEDVFDSIDAVKLRSSMTLFHRADPDDPAFPAVLVKWYGARPDPMTDRLLGSENGDAAT